MKNKIGFGLVGTGWIAQCHIDAITSNPDARLVGIFSNDIERGKKFAKKYDIKHYSDYSNMLKDSDIDVVDIITYSNLHAHFAMKAIEYEKHVLVEKPIDTDIERAKELVKYAKENNKIVSCVSEFRFAEGIQRLKEMVDLNALGQIKAIEVSMFMYRPDRYFLDSHWRGKKETAGGGVVIMNAIHLIDILQWIFGPMKIIDAELKNSRSFVDVEDWASLVLEFQNGIICNMIVTNYAEKSEPIRMEVKGSIKSVVLNDFMMDENRMRDILQDCFNLQVKDMIDSIRYNRPPLTSGEDGVEALKVIDKIYKSSELS